MHDGDDCCNAWKEPRDHSFLLGLIYIFFFVTGWTNHWYGPEGSALPVGLYPQHHQRWMLGCSNITQVTWECSYIHTSVCFSFPIINTSGQGLKRLQAQIRSQIVHKILSIANIYSACLKGLLTSILKFPVPLLILSPPNIQVTKKLPFSVRVYLHTGTCFFLPWRTDSVSMLETLHINPRSKISFQNLPHLAAGQSHKRAVEWNIMKLHSWIYLYCLFMFLFGWLPIFDSFLLLAMLVNDLCSCLSWNIWGCSDVKIKAVAVVPGGAASHLCLVKW